MSGGWWVNVRKIWYLLPPSPTRSRERYYITCLLSDHYLGVITGRESEEIRCLGRLLNYLCLAHHVGISSTLPPFEILDLGLVSVSSNFSRLRQSWSQRVRYRDEIDTCLDSSLVENIAEYRQDPGKKWRENPTFPLYVRTCCSITYIYPMYRYRMVLDLSHFYSRSHPLETNVLVVTWSFPLGMRWLTLSAVANEFVKAAVFPWDSDAFLEEHCRRWQQRLWSTLWKMNKHRGSGSDVHDGNGARKLLMGSPKGW